LREGLTSEGRPLKGYLETQNHAEAIDGLMEIAKKRRSTSHVESGFGWVAWPWWG